MMEFNPPKWKCKNCGDVIFSSVPGEFVSCSCYKNSTDNTGIAVDYTRHYGRHIGNLENFEEVK